MSLFALSTAWRVILLMTLVTFWSSVTAAQSLEFGPPYTVNGSFENPFGIAVNNAQGHLLVSDTPNRKVHWTELTSLSGTTPTFRSFGYVADPAQPEALVDPQGIAADSNGHVYVVDVRRNQVNLYTWNPVASDYELDINFASTTRNNVDGVPIESPRDVAVGPDGKVYLLDSGRKRVLRADGPADTSWEVFISDPGLGNAYGIDVGPDSRVYVADTEHHRVVRYEINGTKTSFGHFGTGVAEFRYPRDVAVDIDGRIHVADTHNHRLVLLDTNGRHLLSLGRAPTFSFIQKIALDAQRRIYLADSDRNSIIAFLGRDAPIPFDGWIRDYLGDSGAQPSDPSFTLSSPDILVRHNSDVDLSAAQTNGLESIVFENPRYDQDNYVYVTVRNRGTQDLRDAVVLLYWTDPASALAFPMDWKPDGFFNGPTPAESSNRIVIPAVPPGGTVVLGPLRFRPPQPETAGLGNGIFMLSARIVHQYDVAQSASGPVAVRASNNVAIRPIRVVRGPFPTGDQNTLVLRVRIPGDPRPSGTESEVQERIAQLAAWINEVSWGQASVKPLFRGELTLPHDVTYYGDPTRNPLVEAVTDALNLALEAEPELLDGTLPSPVDDIGRIVLIVNGGAGGGVGMDLATTGSWPFQTRVGERFLTVSLQPMIKDEPSIPAAFAHGFGHQMGMVDLYAYPNVNFPRPFAAGWDNMALPLTGVHPTVWSKQLASWVTKLGANIIFVPRPARGTTFNQVEIPLVAQTDARPGKNVAIALGLTPGVWSFNDETAFYFVEARTKLGSDIAIPGEGVLMYYVNTQIPQGQGPVIVRDHNFSTQGLEDAILQVGDKESPAGTGIEVLYSKKTIDPAGNKHLIDLNYTPPAEGYDVSIATGDPAWTSPDIWVDNQSDGYDLERGRIPQDRGDVAIGNEENRVYARITNGGDAEAYDIEVAFFLSEPYHTVGGESDFTYLQSVIIPLLPVGETTVYIPWVPRVNDPHTCVKVVLRRLNNDTNAANNAAQQNLSVKWSTSQSPYRPVDFSFQVTNPDPTPKLVYFRADQVPAGWNKQLLPEKVLLDPNEKFTGTIKLTPPPDAPNCKQHDIAITAWTPTSHTISRMGGTTVRMNLAKQADIELIADLLNCGEGEGKSSCSRIRVRGCTNPLQPNTEVVVRYLDPSGKPVYRTVKTDAKGCYEDFFVAVEEGDWTLGASIAPHDCLAPAVAMKTLHVSNSLPKLPRVKQELVRPPSVPQHEQVSKNAKVVQVRMIVEEKLMQIAPDGTKVWALTFNGSVPGPLIVAHEGDYVELTLVNLTTNTMSHNIDFHAATGASGGADLTLIAPGEEVIFRWKAVKAGVFVYNCSPGGIMTPFHVISGMSGAVMVLPKEGLKDSKGKPWRYDRIYYVGEQDFYIPKDGNGKYKTYTQPLEGMADMLKLAKGLIPTHVVFNGAVGALIGDNALKSRVGEKVLFIHSQANRDSSPHLDGGHADLVWQGGSFNDTPITNQETWWVPGGSAVAAGYQFVQPGLYVYLNHNLIEAFLLGAAAHINVEGKWDDDIMTKSVR
ncbi:MAG: nitrite reductase, copper-containing [Nitrosomonas sp.]|nr:nitrite reductase, copper-containing [Nitrosomonas sp.]